MDSKLEKWKILDRRLVHDGAPWLSVELHRVELPSGRIVEDYHRLAGPDFTVVYAITREEKVVVARQYRHGLEKIILDLPAGVIDEGESPLDAARRELLEETGYRAERWESLGAFTLHANYGICRAHFFLAGDALRAGDPRRDDLEEIETVLMTHSEVRDAINSGKMPLMSSAAAALLAQGRICV